MSGPATTCTWWTSQTGESRSLLDATATVTSVAPGGEWLAVNVGENDIHLVSVDGEDRALTTDGTSMDAKWQPSPATAEPSPSPTVVDPFANLGIGSIHVGSEDVAWASTGTKVYRTADGGATWTEVQTPAPHAAALSAAPDADTMFLVTPEPGASVWVTRDAGRSWAKVPFPQEDGTTPPRLTFATPSHGFALFQGEQGAPRVYETTDGGRTWSGPVVGDMPVGLLGKIKGSDSGVLWFATGKADDKAFDNRLVYSVDGGATWQEGRFPTGPQAPKNDLKSVDALWADGTGRVVLAMSLGDGPQLYVSADGGTILALRPGLAQLRERQHDGGLSRRAALGRRVDSRRRGWLGIVVDPRRRRQLATGRGQPDGAPRRSLRHVRQSLHGRPSLRPPQFSQGRGQPGLRRWHGHHPACHVQWRSHLDPGDELITASADDIRPGATPPALAKSP